MTTADRSAWVTTALWATIVGVTMYIAGWAVGGAVREGYDPIDQAISELFALGSPWSSRGPLLAGLLFSGTAMLLAAPALHRSLPGRGLLGPVLVAVAGLGTLAVAAAPCSAGCPGSMNGGIDRAHTIAAGVSYVPLVLAPVAFGWRLRRAMPRLAGWSVALGGIALVGLVVRYLGVVEDAPGLQQRLFNTVADLWYLLVAVVLLRRGGGQHTQPTGSRAGQQARACISPRVNPHHDPAHDEADS